MKKVKPEHLSKRRKREFVVLTVEEHWRAGGFGAAVAEALTELMPVRVYRIAMPDAFVSVAGDQAYLLDRDVSG